MCNKFYYAEYSCSGLTLIKHNNKILLTITLLYLSKILIINSLVGYVSFQFHKFRSYKRQSETSFVNKMEKL